MVQHQQDNIAIAVEAFAEGYQPIPIQTATKRPYGGGWQHTKWNDETELREAFEKASAAGADDVGLLLGAASGGLIDVDLDHPIALRLRDYFLPPSNMETGRAGRPRSHRWYIAENLEELPSTRRYKMPDVETEDEKRVSIELRSTNAQTVIPHSVHPSGEAYRWEGEPWGGEVGPAVVNGRMLAIQVALLGMTAVLVENWPKRGGRHDAYLHLAGGLLRYGEEVHPYWERNLPVLIGALADVTHDDDGPDSRIAETLGTTVTRIREGESVSGFPKLGEVIGEDHAQAVRRMAKEVESLSGFTPEVMRDLEPNTVEIPADPEEYGDLGEGDDQFAELPPESRNPLEERISTWAAVDLGPYLSGQVTMPEPSILRRTDGRGLLYPGLVNSLYGKSESAKSWLSLYACVQEMTLGERAIYLDLEDIPTNTLARMKALGAGDEDLKNQFRYVHPEGPLAPMQRYKFGGKPTEEGTRADAVFKALLDAFDPTLVVIDGMTVLYGLHGHDTNDAMATDVITSWLKSVTRGGRTTVLVIDHTGKGGGPGSSPIGAHHKIAMVQGASLRADAIDRPMPGKVGTINLVVHKDRPGAVRMISSNHSEQIAGEVEMDSTVEGVTRISIAPPQGDTIVIGATDDQEQKLAQLAESEEMLERIIEMFEGDMGRRLTTKDVVLALDVSPNTVYDSWKMLEARQIVLREGSTRWTRFKLRG